MAGQLLLPDNGINGSNHSKIRRYTTKVRILAAIYREGTKSIPDICAITGLSSPTVKKILDDLTDEGLVLCTGLGSSAGGRRPGLYGLNPESRLILGIDIGRYEIRMGLFDLVSQPLIPIRIVKAGLESATDLKTRLRIEMDHLLKEAQVEKKRVMAAGIAFPGLIDRKTGIPYTYFKEEKRPAQDFFAELLGMPVFIEHDTRAMALGEANFGLAKGRQNVLCLNLGTGIGLSLILNGQLYAGNSGYSGEFGHITMDPGGKPCHCGKIGCLETLSSGISLIHEAETAIKNGQVTFLSEILETEEHKITVKAIIDAAKKGDHYSINLLTKAGAYLGSGIATLIHLFNPELIIIGGEMAAARNLITNPIKQNLQLNTIPRILNEAKVVITELGDNAGIMGTVALVMEKVFSGI